VSCRACGSRIVLPLKFLKLSMLSDDSTLLSPTGIWLASDEYGIRKRGLAVGNSCRIQVQASGLARSKERK